MKASTEQNVGIRNGTKVARFSPTFNTQRGSSSTRGTVTVKRSTSNRGRGLSTSRKPQSNFSVPKPVNLEFEPTLNSQKKNTEQSNDASESTSNAQTNSGIVNAWTTKPSDDSEKNNAWENNKSESSIINDEAFPSLGKDEKLKKVKKSKTEDSKKSKTITAENREREDGWAEMDSDDDDQFFDPELEDMIKLQTEQKTEKEKHSVPSESQSKTQSPVESEEPAKKITILKKPHQEETQPVDQQENPDHSAQSNPSSTKNNLLADIEKQNETMLKLADSVREKKLLEEQRLEREQKERAAEKLRQLEERMKKRKEEEERKKQEEAQREQEKLKKEQEKAQAEHKNSTTEDQSSTSGRESYQKRDKQYYSKYKSDSQEGGDWKKSYSEDREEGTLQYGRGRGRGRGTFTTRGRGRGRLPFDQHNAENKDQTEQSESEVMEHKHYTKKYERSRDQKSVETDQNKQRRVPSKSYTKSENADDRKPVNPRDRQNKKRSEESQNPSKERAQIVEDLKRLQTTVGDNIVSNGVVIVEKQTGIEFENEDGEWTQVKSERQKREEALKQRKLEQQREKRLRQKKKLEELNKQDKTSTVEKSAESAHPDDTTSDKMDDEISSTSTDEIDQPTEDNNEEGNAVEQPEEDVEVERVGEVEKQPEEVPLPDTPLDTTGLRNFKPSSHGKIAFGSLDEDLEEEVKEGRDEEAARVEPHEGADNAPSAVVEEANESVTAEEDKGTSPPPRFSPVNPTRYTPSPPHLIPPTQPLPRYMNQPYYIPPGNFTPVYGHTQHGAYVMINPYAFMPTNPNGAPHMYPHQMRTMPNQLVRPYITGAPMQQGAYDNSNMPHPPRHQKQSHDGHEKRKHDHPHRKLRNDQKHRTEHTTAQETNVTENVPTNEVAAENVQEEADTQTKSETTYSSDQNRGRRGRGGTRGGRGRGRGRGRGKATFILQNPEDKEGKSEVKSNDPPVKSDEGKKSDHPVKTHRYSRGGFKPMKGTRKYIKMDSDETKTTSDSTNTTNTTAE